MAGVDGLMGVTGREWCVYHVNTLDAYVSNEIGVDQGWEEIEMEEGVLLCPNLVGSLLAPTTAK